MLNITNMSPLQPEIPPDTDFDARDSLVVLTQRDLLGLESYLRDRYYALLSSAGNSTDHEPAHRIRRLGIDTDSIQVRLSDYNENHSPQRRPFDYRRSMAIIEASQTTSDSRWAGERTVRLGGLALQDGSEYDAIYNNTKENLMQTPLNALELLHQQCPLRDSLQQRLTFAESAAVPTKQNGVALNEVAQTWSITCQSPRRYGRQAYENLDRTLDDLEQTIDFGCTIYPHSSYRIVPGKKDWRANVQRLRPSLSGTAINILGLQEEMWLKQQPFQLHRYARSRTLGHIQSLRINPADDVDNDGLDELEAVLIGYYKNGKHASISHRVLTEGSDGLNGIVYVYSKSPGSILPSYWHLGI